LFIGSAAQREVLGVTVSQDIASRWRDDRCVLEALKDGVHFRPVQETLAVDNFLVIRPNLQADEMKQALERIVRHEGKQYNFDFDFFSSDRLVCSEVVYRAFDGLGGLKFPLTERAGRHTLSPEDLVRFALESDAMQVVGIFGVDGARQSYVSGEMAERLATATLQQG